jgi:DNA polymerase-2
MTLDRVGSSILSFDSLYIRQATKEGFVSPTMKYSQKDVGITGGFVMSPVPGIYDNVLVFDFKSLYPSIIRTFNIDPLSFIGMDKKKGVCLYNGACYKNTEGVLPKILDRLHSAREKAKREKREFSSYAIKITMNSFFGVLASPNCRYFNMDIANSITQTGQELIKKTQKLLEGENQKVIYGDTDSIFVDSTGSKKDSVELGKKLEKEINSFYDNYIIKDFKRKSFLELEFEKLYLSLIIPPVRGSKSGAKKRYAGLRKEGSGEKMEVVGLEAIRGDWTEAAQIFQKELLDLIFHKKDFKKYISEFVSKLKSGKADDLLVYRKRLRKNLEEYIKTTPPHVKAARKLKVVEGNLIEYVITSAGPEPISDLKHKIDYEHYIDKQIKPIANSLLGFFDVSFDEILNGSKQTSLSNF